jgi:peptidyl-prolyl cis-trans isomerase B (cyclophilin B)
VGTAKRERQKAGRQARLEALQVQQRRAKTKNTALKIGGLIAGIAALVFVLWLAFRNNGDDTNATTDTSPSTSVSTETTVDVNATVDPNASTAAPTTVVQGPFTYGTTECPPAGGATLPTKTFTAAFKLCIDAAKTYTATFDTSEGKIVVALDTKRTPGTTNNFVSLARSGYYTDTLVFRTDPGIDIIQGGGATNSDTPGYEIPDEGGAFTYTEGDLVMARTGAPNSAGGQWFVATGPNVSLLDGQGTYVTFGKVTTGLDVVKNIIGLHAADDSGLGGKPSREVKVKTITITES